MEKDASSLVLIKPTQNYNHRGDPTQGPLPGGLMNQQQSLVLPLTRARTRVPVTRTPGIYVSGTL